MVAPVFISGRTNHRALKTIPLFSNYSMCESTSSLELRIHEPGAIWAFFLPKQAPTPTLMGRIKITRSQNYGTGCDCVIAPGSQLN